MLKSLILLLGLLPKFFIVQSGSMEPAIKTGSLVITTKSAEYNNGDIISFKSKDDPKRIITHRIGYRDEKGILTIGDANEKFDLGRTDESQIIGKVVFTIPYIGYVANLAKNPKGFILLVIIPATIIIYEELKFLSGEFLKLKSKKSIPKSLIVVPLVGMLIVFTGLTISYFSDNETSIGNTMQAAGPPSPIP